MLTLSVYATTESEKAFSTAPAAAAAACLEQPHAPLCLIDSPFH